MPRATALSAHSSRSVAAHGQATHHPKLRLSAQGVSTSDLTPSIIASFDALFDDAKGLQSWGAPSRSAGAWCSTSRASVSARGEAVIGSPHADLTCPERDYAQRAGPTRARASLRAAWPSADLSLIGGLCHLLAPFSGVVRTYERATTDTRDARPMSLGNQLIEGHRADAMGSAELPDAVKQRFHVVTEPNSSERQRRGPQIGIGGGQM